MSFGAPLGLLALLGLAPILAAYFLRRKQPPRTVSALFLWRQADRRAEAGPKFERFSREASLALELLAVLCAALFLADAKCGAGAPRTQLVVVVDGSLSMLARTGGASAAERVKRAVASLAREHEAGALTIIESGTRPSLLAGPQQEPGRALAALEAWQPAQPAHDLTPAFVLARELAGPSQTVYFFTDGPPPEGSTLPSQVEGRSVGRKADNVAFLSAQRRDEGAGAKKRATVTVRVGNFSEQERAVTVHFEAADDAPHDETVQLAAGASAVLRAGFLTALAIAVSVPDDALPEDGHLTLLPSPLAELQVGLLDGLDPQATAALERFLAIAPAVRRAPEAAFTIGGAGSSARLTIGASGKPLSFVGPFFAQKSHPLFDDVPLGGVVWTAGENPPGRALMSMGQTVLISEEDDGTLHFNLDVGRSNVQRTVAWPVLLGNVVRLARLNSPGFPRKHLMLGEEVPVVTAAGAQWALEAPNKQRRPVLGAGALTLPPLPATGTWRLLRDGAPFDELEVLPLDPREADLRTRGPWEAEAAQTSALASLGDATPRAYWPIALLLALLLADFALTARVPRSWSGS